MNIFNLTQHEASAEQLEAGVLPRTDLQANQVKELLTFTTPPSKEEIKQRAEALAEVVAIWRSEATMLTRDIYIRDHVRDGDFIPPASFYNEDFSLVMIGGAPYLMSALEKALEAKFFTPVYAYSERVSEEHTQSDGSVKKVNVFKHICFV